MAPAHRKKLTYRQVAAAALTELEALHAIHRKLRVRLLVATNANRPAPVPNEAIWAALREDMASLQALDRTAV